MRQHCWYFISSLECQTGSRSQELEVLAKVLWKAQNVVESSIIKKSSAWSRRCHTRSWFGKPEVVVKWQEMVWKASPSVAMWKTWSSCHLSCMIMAATSTNHQVVAASDRDPADAPVWHSGLIDDCSPPSAIWLITVNVNRVCYLQLCMCSLDHYSQETTLLHQIFGGYLRSQGTYYSFDCSVVVMYQSGCIQHPVSWNLILYLAKSFIRLIEQYRIKYRRVHLLCTHQCAIGAKVAH